MSFWYYSKYNHNAAKRMGNGWRRPYGDSPIVVEFNDSGLGGWYYFANGTKEYKTEIRKEYMPEDTNWELITEERAFLLLL